MFLCHVSTLCGGWRGTHFYLGGDEERRDAEQLQVLFADVLLGQHEAVEVVLSEVRRLPVEAVHFTHLHADTAVKQFDSFILLVFEQANISRPHLQQPVQQDGSHLGLQLGVSLQVALVVDVLQLLVEHFDPHVVWTGPAGRQNAGFTMLFTCSSQCHTLC